jgi:hypothetical protein
MNGWSVYNMPFNTLKRLLILSSGPYDVPHVKKAGLWYTLLLKNCNTGAIFQVWIDSI